MRQKVKASPPKAAAPLRRSPRQARAQQSVGLIFEATAQVLREEGEAALTTNRIAERAGLSIGTLYQYFDSKEAIVVAMLSRERERVMKQLETLLSGFDAGSPDQGKSDPRQILRAYVRQYVSTFGTGARTQRALVRLAWRLDANEAIVVALREASERIAMHLQRINHPLIRPPTPAMVFVLTRALAGIVRSAALEESPLLGTQAFENELVNALWGVLGAARDG
jgi:AcrR family transcriptional regulator